MVLTYFLLPTYLFNFLLLTILFSVKPILTRLSELRLSLNDFKLGPCIGRGACGLVRVVREIASPHSVYAMKSQYKGVWLHHDPVSFVFEFFVIF